MGMCHVCGSRLTPGLSWCPICYAAVADPGPEHAPGPFGVSPTANPLRAPRPPLPDRWFPPEPSVPQTRAFMRRTETTFGPVAKIVITAAFVVVGVATVFFAARFSDFTGRSGNAFVMFWSVTFAALAAVTLFQVWKPGKLSVRNDDIPVIRRPAPTTRRVAVRVPQPEGGHLVVLVPEAEAEAEAARPTPEPAPPGPAAAPPGPAAPRPTRVAHPADRSDLAELVWGPPSPPASAG